MKKEMMIFAVLMVLILSACSRTDSPEKERSNRDAVSDTQEAYRKIQFPDVRVIGAPDDARDQPAEDREGVSEDTSDTVDTISENSLPQIEAAAEAAQAAAEIPRGSVAIFYRTSLSDVAHRLPVSVQDRSLSGDGYVTNIRWEADEKGVVRYIPAAERFDVMKTTTSYSYSKSSINPFTIDGRVFTITTRGDTSDINELDPKTAKNKAGVSINGNTFAILGDTIYYREKIRTNLYDQVSGGGALVVKKFNEIATQELLPYGNEDNKGSIYGVGGKLLSVYDESIRLHDLSTGRITQILHTGLADYGTFFAGDDALYQVTAENKVYRVHRYPLEGEARQVAEITLESGEKGVSVDEENGILLFVIYGDTFKVTSVILNDFSSGSVVDIPFETFGSVSSQEYQFVFLD